MATGEIDDVEDPVILSKPPAKRIPFRAVIVTVPEAQKDLGLSDEDWASLGLEELEE